MEMKTRHSCKKRKAYSYEEDMDMINYINTHNKFIFISGNEMWEEMQIKKITCHSAASMRTHFLKIILKNIDKYSLSDGEKNRFLSILPFNIKDSQPLNKLGNTLNVKCRESIYIQSPPSKSEISNKKFETKNGHNIGEKRHNTTQITSLGEMIPLTICHTPPLSLPLLNCSNEYDLRKLTPTVNYNDIMDNENNDDPDIPSSSKSPSYIVSNDHPHENNYNKHYRHIDICSDSKFYSVVDDDLNERLFKPSLVPLQDIFSGDDYNINTTITSSTPISKRQRCSINDDISVNSSQAIESDDILSVSGIFPALYNKCKSLKINLQSENDKITHNVNAVTKAQKFVLLQEFCQTLDLSLREILEFIIDQA
ncbi:unnamed protein product [Gordionus sp. m RMFG-2023]|uniref:uncharacterized protein LOC135932012 isoform X2 n=1 Tax=Gordionus sp. m RMFG-2023 TaxID=3053472 RepID=UPI0030DF6528